MGAEIGPFLLASDFAIRAWRGVRSSRGRRRTCCRMKCPAPIRFRRSAGILYVHTLRGRPIRPAMWQRRVRRLQENCRHSGARPWRPRRRRGALIAQVVGLASCAYALKRTSTRSRSICSRPSGDPAMSRFHAGLRGEEKLAAQFPAQLQRTTWMCRALHLSARPPRLPRGAAANDDHHPTFDRTRPSA